MAKGKAREREAEPVAPVATGTGPELWGVALEPREGGFVACRISTSGAREYIGPKKADGTQRVESKALALARAFDAFKAEYAPPSRMRFGA